MKTGHGRALALTLVLALGACTSGSQPGGGTVPSPTASSDPSPTPAIQDVMDLENFSPLQPGTYSIDADLDPSTPLRVVYEIPAEGWLMWIGAAKLAEEGTTCSSSGCPGHPSGTMVSITTVVNLVTDGCRNHFAAVPPVGPTVDNLATALSELAPFEVTSPTSDVTVYGYRGKHLELTVPDMAFDRCDAGDLRSWIAPMDAAEVGDAFYGYTGPGYREEFWILDVEGTRLMIAAERSPGSPSEDLAELNAILDSIRIEL